MKIDAWPHILPKPYLDRLGAIASGPLAGNLRILTAIRCLSDLEVRFRVMDQYPDYVQILTLVPGQHLPVAPSNPTLASELARLANDAMAELVATYPDRFRGFAASLPLHDLEHSILRVARASFALPLPALRRSRVMGPSGSASMRTTRGGYSV